MPDHGMSLLQSCKLTSWLVKHVCEGDRVMVFSFSVVSLGYETMLGFVC